MEWPIPQPGQKLNPKILKIQNESPGKDVSIKKRNTIAHNQTNCSVYFFLAIDILLLVARKTGMTVKYNKM